MNRFIMVFIILLSLTLITGCYAEKQLISLKDETNHNVIVKYLNKKDTVSSTILTGEVDGQKKEYIFNTKNEKISEYKEISSAEGYKVDIDNKGYLKIYEQSSNNILFSLNLKKYGFVEINGSIPVNKDWSLTKRYLLLGQPQSNRSILIDIATKKCIDLPIKGYVSLQWYNNDTKAILGEVLNSEGNDDSILMYYWNVENNDIGKLNVNFETSFNLNWSPNGKVIYYITTKDFDGIIGYSFMCYRIDEKKWKEIYSTRMDIFKESIKWISDDEVIFPVSNSITLNPARMVSGKLNYYAVKVNIKTKSVTKIEIDGYQIASFLWSDDNKYIYYCDNNGFWKARVSFNK